MALNGMTSNSSIAATAAQKKDQTAFSHPE